MVIAQQQDNKSKRIAMAISLVFHGLLLLFFLLWKIITPIPPFPEPGGGGGELGIELGPDLGESSPAPSVQPTPPQQEQEETLLTEDDEENPVLPEPAKPDKTPKPKPKPEAAKPVKPAPPVVQPPKANPNALFTPGGTGKGGSGTTGGSTTGSGGTGGGDGGPGSGGGSGGGTGGGTGAFQGKGFQGHLGGRGLVRGPSIAEKPDVEGRIALDIYVDRTGKVTHVAWNPDRSTSSNTTLRSLATKAALQCTFSPKPDGPAEQKGEMVFIFQY